MNAAAPRIWIVRAGREGQYEDLALSQNVVVIGWAELGPIGAEISREDIRQRIQETYGEERPQSLASQAGQIFRFVNEVAPGDIVVLPHLAPGERGAVSIGRVNGPYRYRDEAEFAEDARHTRPVEWLVQRQPYPAFSAALRDSFGAQGTVSEISLPGAAEELLEAVGSSRSVWLFQANPKYYDIDNAVKSLDTINWAVKDYADEIAPGDRVYIWRSGQDGGVIAVGTILSAPALAAEQEGSEFIRDQSMFEGEQLRVRLSLDHVLDPWLLRTALREMPTLNDLGVLRFPRGTNYPVTEEEDRELQSLISGQTRLEGHRVWWVNQGATYRQERDGSFVWAPLESKGGTDLAHWRSLEDADVDDRVLHYANGSIRAVGRITRTAEQAQRPDDLPGDAWADEGRIVRVDYAELAEPVALADIPVSWRLEHGAPFTAQGAVYQGYFYPLDADFVSKLAARFPQLKLGDSTPPSGPSHVSPEFATIRDAVEKAGLVIDEQTLRRYHLSLRTRGFVILSGVSGTGKTWLAELYAEVIGANHLTVPVAPNWTTNEDLLGFFNPLTESFQFTEFTEFLREAAAEFEAAQAEHRDPRPFHVTLDEMNLAHVEYYFAKFLSALELRNRHGTATVDLSPGDVLLGPNLRFTGTVNVDETTHGFADKVYDRAQLIELTAPREALSARVANRSHGNTLMAAWDAVAEVAPFAFRVVDEIDAYVTAAADMGIDWQTALDEQILQKVLPKVKGTDLRIGDALASVIAMSEGVLPLTHAKAEKMRDGFTEHQFASYF